MELEKTPVVNPGKNEVITVDGVDYRRLCIKTHVIKDGDSIPEVAMTYAAPHMQEGDILFITEKAVACTQKRAIPLRDIHPRPLARFLSKFVLKTPHGGDRRRQEDAEGAALPQRHLHRLRGWFYKVAGDKARAIDGPCDFTLPPYNEYVVLGPADPDKVAEEVSARTGHPTLITDINDLGGNILGRCPRDLPDELYTRVLKDNPLGQQSEQTPMGIIRRVEA